MSDYDNVCSILSLRHPCRGCERKVIKKVKKIPGVHSAKADNNGNVIVYGTAEHDVVQESVKHLVDFAEPIADQEPEQPAIQRQKHGSGKGRKGFFNSLFGKKKKNNNNKNNKNNNNDDDYKEPEKEDRRASHVEEEQVQSYKNDDHGYDHFEYQSYMSSRNYEPIDEMTMHRRFMRDNYGSYAPPWVNIPQPPPQTHTGGPYDYFNDDNVNGCYVM